MGAHSGAVGGRGPSVKVARACTALAALLLLTAGCEPAGPGTPPNVLLITLDTTRADRLTLYGHDRPNSPNLSALGAESIVYENAYSTSSWTLPAHASLFTGKFPSSHGVRHDPQGPLILAREISAPDTVRARGIAPGERTLAEQLRSHGYRTGAVVAGPWLIEAFGFGKGFDDYDDDGIRDNAGRRAREVTDRALDWIARPGDEPWFLFLNYFDPHAPYAPPAPFASAFLPPGERPNPRSAGQALALYDAEILYMDHELGRLLDGLRESGDFENAMIVITSDHGELFGEHGEWGHERFLWEPLVRVPLIIKPPGRVRAQRLTQRISLVDVMPKILRQVGIEGPDPSGAVLAEVNPMSPSNDTGDWQARWEGSNKYLVNSLGEHYLFDLERDPVEIDNLVEREPGLAARAHESLEQAFADLPPPPAPGGELRVDPRTVEALRRMGYLEAAEEATPPDPQPGE